MYAIYYDFPLQTDLVCLCARCCPAAQGLESMSDTLWLSTCFFFSKWWCQPREGCLGRKGGGASGICCAAPACIFEQMRLLSLFPIYNVAGFAGPKDDLEESGWKMVSGDVFRTPTDAIALCVQVGSGVQIIASATLTLFFAALGRSPSHTMYSTSVGFVYNTPLKSKIRY